ncbi:MAG: 23S rRNA (guanosine(2251)-2'-O)-methyltransferase RlmB [Geminicoccaceae bacterium]
MRAWRSSAAARTIGAGSRDRHPAGESLVLALDQVTDPRNFGAIMRAAAAFGVNAVVVPERRSAELNGAAAKAAAGAIDIVPIVEVVNLSRALERLKQAGYWVTGLDGDGERTIGESHPGDRRVLVLGSEGSGIRRLVGETCDEIVRIEMDKRMESLNVATAAAVALYEFARK